MADRGTTGADREQLEAAKRASVGHLLLKTARLFNERAAASYAARSGTALRPSHLSVFPHLDFGGTRLTVLAERMGISKQAVGQLVTFLEEANMVERVADPSDGRARLVRFTEAGERRLLDGLAVLVEVEEALTPEVGEATMAALHDGLSRLLSALDRRTENAAD